MIFVKQMVWEVTYISGDGGGDLLPSFAGDEFLRVRIILEKYWEREAEIWPKWSCRWTLKWSRFMGKFAIPCVPLRNVYLHALIFGLVMFIFGAFAFVFFFIYGIFWLVAQLEMCYFFKRKICFSVNVVLWHSALLLNGIIWYWLKLSSPFLCSCISSFLGLHS